MMTWLQRRLPDWESILAVFAVIASFMYGRTIYIFLFKVPAWQTFLRAAEIGSTLAYGLAYDLAESLGMLGFLLGVCVLLPSAWFRDHFVAHAAWFVTFVLGSILLYFRHYAATGLDALAQIESWAVLTLALAIPVAYAGGRIGPLNRFAVAAADRLIVLLLIFVPASLISILVVLGRNIFRGLQ